MRELDTISCDDKSKFMNDEVFEYNDFADPANNNIFAKINQQADSTKPKSYKKRVRCTADRIDISKRKELRDIKRECKILNSEINVNNDCKILGTVCIHMPNRTEWPEYRYIQVDENWQRNACIRMGLQFKHSYNLNVYLNAKLVMQTLF